MSLSPGRVGRCGPEFIDSEKREVRTPRSPETQIEEKRMRALEASENNQKNARAAPCGAAPVKVMGMQLGSYSQHEQHIAREPT